MIQYLCSHAMFSLQLNNNIFIHELNIFVTIIYIYHDKVYYIYKTKQCGVIGCTHCVQYKIFFTDIHVGIVSSGIDYNTICLSSATRPW